MYLWSSAPGTGHSAATSGAGEDGGVGHALLGEEQRGFGDVTKGGQAFGDLQAGQTLDLIAERLEVGGGFLLHVAGRFIPEATGPGGRQVGQRLGQSTVGGHALISQAVVRMVEEVGGIEPAEARPPSGWVETRVTASPRRDSW